MESLSTPQSQERAPLEDSLDISSLLNDLFTAKSKDQILQILHKLNAHIKEKKVPFKSLQTDISSIITTRSSLSELIPQLLDLHILAFERKLDATLSDSFILACCTLACGSRHQMDEHVQKIVLDKFAKIDPSHILKYYQDFKLIETISTGALVLKIDDLLKQKRFVLAAKCIDSFHLQRELAAAIPGLVTNLIKEKEIKTIKFFVKYDQSRQRLAIEKAIKLRDYHLASGLIRQYKMDPWDYPEVIYDLQRGSVRYFAKTLDWMRLEEKFVNDKDLLSLCVENLIKKKQISEAFSIIERHQLLSCAAIPFHLKKKFKSKCYSDPDVQFLQNNLFEFDDYAPTEELLKINEPGTFLNMEDFGLEIEKDLMYIEEISTDKSVKAINEILSSKFISLDSEFTCCLTKFDRQRIALLQIATNEKIYVFNVLKMKEKPAFEIYQNFVRDLLSNPEIIKIGHTIETDLNMMTENQKITIKSTVDIAKIYKTLYPENKYALAAICQDLLGKPMSKYEQTSNWENPRLRKAQILYGGMDALITLKLFEKLREEIEKKGEDYTQLAGVKIGTGEESSQKEEINREDEKVEQ